MNVTVRYLAQLRHAAGRPEDVVGVPGPLPVSGLLAELAGRRPAMRSSFLTHAGRPQPTLLVFVGDEQVGHDHPLKDGDVVTLLTPVAGGGADADRPDDH